MNLTRIVFLGSIFIALLFPSNTLAAGELDTAFNVAAYQLPGYSALPPMKSQPDGKLIIAPFEYIVNNGIACKGICRFNVDGTLDPTFNGPVFSAGTIEKIELQSTGKIILRGNFALAFTQYDDFARLNTDGSVDMTFNANLPTLAHDSYALGIAADDSIYTGSAYKFDANGNLDNTFQYQPYFGYVTNIVPLADGKVIIGADVPMSSGFDYVTRHNPDGSRDMGYTGWSPNGYARRMIPQPDGKLLVAGTFSFLGGTMAGGIGRMNEDGTPDATFNPGGTEANAVVADMLQFADGRILIAGSFSQYNGITMPRFARLTVDGALDPTFSFTGVTTSVFPSRIELLSDGKVACIGSLVNLQNQPTSLIMFGPSGTQLPQFSMQKAIPQRVRTITVAPDGKMYVAGLFTSINGYRRLLLARLNADGTVDPSFDPFFPNQFGSPTIRQVLIQPDGKILVSFNNGFVITRLNTNGSRDTTFNTTLPTSSIIADIALQADGKILYAGEVDLSGGTPLFGRLNSNGTADTTFTPPLPNSRIHRVVVQPDGKSIIAGEFTQISATNRGRIARYNTNGTLDDTFAPAGGASGNIYDIDLQADGKIVVGGTFSSLNGSSARDKIGRLNSDGSLDTSFAQGVDTTVQAVKAQPDGKILIGGLFTNVGGTARDKLARLNANGTVDTTFNASANGLVFDINIQANGKVLVAGDFTVVNNVTKLGIARLNSSIPSGKLFDYDGDGKADVSVFRPSENRWYILRSSDQGVTERQFAAAGDVAVPADFDGDRKTDIAIYRPASADWWSLSSQSGSQINANWGQVNARPLPSDFDGDGKHDYIYFLPSNSTWYRFGSTVGAAHVVFGTTGDKPLIGDFDGDGKSDPAIYRPSTGEWWWQSSVDNVQRATRWGIVSDIPTAADFDGDGKTDFAVYRPSSGTWYIYNSSTNLATILNFGLSDDRPVAADYDGDGKTDVAVFRPSTGVWYLQRSMAGFTALQFGNSSDTPTPNTFIP